MGRADRREFPRAVKVAVVRRATTDGVTYCEGCGALAKKWQIDHRRADGLFGEPTLENAQLLGSCCYGPKNAADAGYIAEAKRREARSLLLAPPGRRKVWWRHGKDRKPPVKVAPGPPALMRRGFEPA